ncbi:UNVERIFIED_CONTAM: mercuric ion transport protein [Brevibacillus sp. OAP136]
MQVGRLLYKGLAWIFLSCIVLQVFIAGLATFSTPVNWALHQSFVKIFAFVPLVMFLLTFIGGIKGRDRWISLWLFLLIVFQFLTIQVFASVFVLASLHPVIALLLFWGSVITVRNNSVGN